MALWRFFVSCLSVCLIAIRFDGRVAILYYIINAFNAFARGDGREVIARFAC